MRQSGISVNDQTITSNMDAQGPVGDTDMEDIEESDHDETREASDVDDAENKCKTRNGRLDYGFSSFTERGCSESEQSVIENEEDMTSSGKASDVESDRDDDDDCEVKSESDEEQSEPEQVVPSCDEDMSYLFGTDYADVMIESKRIDAKLRTRFDSKRNSNKLCKVSFPADYSESFMDFGVRGKLQISDRYRFPRLTPSDIDEIVNFWELDFQVGHYIVPRIGSWESNSLVPQKDSSPVDYHKYETYRDLYRKWLQCNRSLDQWYAKYGLMSLENIVHCSRKGQKRKFNTRRPLSATSRSPRVKRTCFGDKF